MFQGFSQQTLDFLWGIRFNNDRAWFEAHKETYLTTLYRPMQALAEEVYETFLTRHNTLDLVCRVSRIYRDARRLHGRGPYKDRLWCSMERPKEDDWIAQPVYWFELEPEGYSYGLGYWAAPPVTMAKFRARLDRDPEPFSQLVRAFQKQKIFALTGEDYKRPKGTTTPLLNPWYQKRSFSLACERPHDEGLFSHDLVDRLLKGYEWLLPYYDYLMLLEGDPAPAP